MSARAAAERRDFLWRLITSNPTGARTASIVSLIGGGLAETTGAYLSTPATVWSEFALPTTLGVAFGAFINDVHVPTTARAAMQEAIGRYVFFVASVLTFSSLWGWAGDHVTTGALLSLVGGALIGAGVVLVHRRLIGPRQIRPGDSDE